MHEKGAIHNGADVDDKIWNRLNVSDATLRSDTDLYLKSIVSVIRHKPLYTTDEPWTWFAQYTEQINRLPELYYFHPSSVEVTYGLTHPTISTTLVIDIARGDLILFNTNKTVAERIPPSDHAPYMTIAAPCASGKF